MKIYFEGYQRIHLELAAAKIKHLPKIKTVLAGTRNTDKNTKNTTRYENKLHLPQIPQLYQECKGRRLNYHLKATRASTSTNHVKLWWYQTDIIEPPKVPRLLKASKGLQYLLLQFLLYSFHKKIKKNCTLVCCIGYRNEVQKLFYNQNNKLRKLRNDHTKEMQHQVSLPM